jgi:GT2 family glycosyltransferase
MLTHNRLDFTKRSLEHNMKNAGYQHSQFVWIDNGSTDGTREYAEKFNPDVLILNKDNLGVSKGLNRGMVLSTSDWVVITGQDMLMPSGWLAKFAECVEKIPNTGIISMYSVPIDKVPERKRGDQTRIDGILIQPAMPMGRRMFRRSLLKDIGYFREDFGLYGYEDVCWGYRAENVCTAKNYRFYNLPEFIPYHLGEDDLETEEEKKRYREYTEWKKNTAHCKDTIDKMQWNHRVNFPYFSPYI